MSMYTLLQGANPLAPVLLALLDLSPHDIARIRDVRVATGYIVVYTRSRDHNEKMEHHPCFSHAETAVHDDTYASFYFRFPPAYSELLDEVQDTEPFNPAREFESAMKELELTGKVTQFKRDYTAEQKDAWLKIVRRLEEQLTNPDPKPCC